MKNIFACSGAVAFLLVCGCSQQEPAQTSSAPPPDVEKIAAEVKAKANVPAPPTPATPVVAEPAPPAPAQAAVTSAGETVSSKAQGLIDLATKLLSEKKWEDALKTLGELTTLKLTPEQQKTVESLKQQAQALAQSATTDKASKAVTDLLKKP